MLNKEMFFFLKSLSRTVHDHDADQQQEHNINEEAKNVLVGEYGNSTSFTVWRKSLLISCSGFTVIDSNGDLVYRVDNYCLHPQELVLMDASGKSILTLMHRHKKMGVSENWEIYEGDQASGNCNSTTTILDHHKKPNIALWRVKKNKKKNILEVFNNNKSVEVAHVLRSGRSQCSSYVIEGCYRNRSCKVMDIESRRVMAEIKRKKNIINGGISFGEDVFVLVVNFGFDPAFAMALVLLLDQMFS